MKIQAVLSSPRVGWTDFWGEAYAALSPLGIPIQRYTGAYWDQGLQLLLEDALTAGADYIITLDFDSLFTTRDVTRLMATLENDSFGERVDAVAAMQPKRGSQAQLWKHSRRGVNNREPFDVATAHFGLTLLRASVLARVERPWFLHRPDAANTYRSEDRIDADEWFWHQWRAAGANVFIDPGVKLGHLEVMVSEFDENLTPRYVSVEAWRQAHAAADMSDFEKGF